MKEKSKKGKNRQEKGQANRLARHEEYQLIIRVTNPDD